MLRYDESCSGEVNYNEFVEKLMESDFHGVAHSGHRTNLTRMASSAFGIENGEDDLGSKDEDSDLDEEERDDFRRTEIKKVFDHIDIDGSGSIDREEVMLLLKQLNLKADETQVEEGFRCLDKDKSGRIEYDEFYDWYSKTCFQ